MPSWKISRTLRYFKVTNAQEIVVWNINPRLREKFSAPEMLVRHFRHLHWGLSRAKFWSTKTQNLLAKRNAGASAHLFYHVHFLLKRLLHPLNPFWVVSECIFSTFRNGENKESNSLFVLPTQWSCTLVPPSVGSNVHVSVPKKSPASSISIRRPSTSFFSSTENFADAPWLCPFMSQIAPTQSNGLTPSWLESEAVRHPMCAPWIFIQNSLVNR